VAPGHAKSILRRLRWPGGAARGGRMTLTVLGQGANEGGVTLIELLMAMALGLVILGAALIAMVDGLSEQSRVTNRVSTAQMLETAAAAMVNELRPAASVLYVSGTGNLEITLTPPSTVIPAGGTTAGSQVTYDCYTTSGTCIRRIGAAATHTFATRIVNANVFTLECRTAAGDLQAVTNGGSTSGCANGIDYVAIKLVASVGCSGERISAAGCSDGQVEVDGGTSLRSQS